MDPNWHKQRRSASSAPSARLGAIVDKVNAGKMGESAAIAAPSASLGARRFDSNRQEI
jgi:hypothetical protein